MSIFQKNHRFTRNIEPPFVTEERTWTQMDGKLGGRNKLYAPFNWKSWIRPCLKRSNQCIKKCTKTETRVHIPRYVTKQISWESIAWGWICLSELSLTGIPPVRLRRSLVVVDAHKSTSFMRLSCIIYAQCSSVLHHVVTVTDRRQTERRHISPWQYTCTHYTIPTYACR